MCVDASTLHQPFPPLPTGNVLLALSGDVYEVASVREAGLAEISPLVDKANDKLFHKILNDTNHVLFKLLPDQRGELTYFKSKSNLIPVNRQHLR